MQDQQKYKPQKEPDCSDPREKEEEDEISSRCLDDKSGKILCIRHTHAHAAACIMHRLRWIG